MLIILIFVNFSQVFRRGNLNFFLAEKNLFLPKFDDIFEPPERFTTKFLNPSSLDNVEEYATTFRPQL